MAFTGVGVGMCVAAGFSGFVPPKLRAAGVVVAFRMKETFGPTEVAAVAIPATSTSPPSENATLLFHCFFRTMCYRN